MVSVVFSTTAVTISKNTFLEIMDLRNRIVLQDQSLLLELLLRAPVVEMCQVFCLTLLPVDTIDTITVSVMVRFLLV